jgi:ribose transport system permease protein
LAIVVIAGACIGLLNGLLIVKFKLQSLVTTIGMNGLLMGSVLLISNGTPGNAPQLLGRFALGRTAGIPNTLLIACFVTIVVSVMVERTKIGRRFVLSGSNGPAAHAVGLRTGRIEVGAYAMAGVCYAVSGILLAGLLSVPSLDVGQIYLLTTVAAVVLGGNPIAGGRASALSTMIGALFMTQLGQMLVAAGFERSVQNLMQGVIVIAGASIHAMVPRLLSSRSSTAAK